MYIVVRGTRHLENVHANSPTVPICCRRLLESLQDPIFGDRRGGARSWAWNVAFVRLSGWDPVKHAALTREQLLSGPIARDACPSRSRSARCRGVRPLGDGGCVSYDGRDYEVSRGEMSAAGLSCAVSTSPRSCATRRPCARARRWRRPASSRAAWAHDFQQHPAGHPGEPRPGEGRGQCRSGGAGAPQRGQRGGRSGARLTQQLLAFARRQPLAPQPTSVARLVHDLADLLRHSLGERVTMQLDISDDPLARQDRSWSARERHPQSRDQRARRHARWRHGDHRSVQRHARSALRGSASDVTPGPYVLVAVNGSNAWEALGPHARAGVVHGDQEHTARVSRRDAEPRSADRAVALDTSMVTVPPSGMRRAR